MSDETQEEKGRSPRRISRLALLVSVIAASFAAWIIIAANSG
ncbi:MAG TPA: hypothetical protein VF681_11265 [Abditibacteriaceae bacterium]|jgi:hypothetical protein